MVYLSSSTLAVLGLHASFISLIAGRSLLVPMTASLIFTVVAGGYAWPPIANKPGWSEAARLVGWTDRWAHRRFVLMNVIAFLLIVDAVIYLSTS